MVSPSSSLLHPTGSQQQLLWIYFLSSVLSGKMLFLVVEITNIFHWSCFCLSSFVSPSLFSFHKVIPDSSPRAPFHPSLSHTFSSLHPSLCLLFFSSSPRRPKRIIVKKQPGEELPRETFREWSMHLHVTERARFINPQSKSCPQWSLEKIIIKWWKFSKSLFPGFIKAE